MKNSINGGYYFCNETAHEHRDVDGREKEQGPENVPEEFLPVLQFAFGSSLPWTAESTLLMWKEENTAVEGRTGKKYKKTSLDNILEKGGYGSRLWGVSIP